MMMMMMKEKMKIRSFNSEDDNGDEDDQVSGEGLSAYKICITMRAPATIWR